MLFRLTDVEAAGRDVRQHPGIAHFTDQSAQFRRQVGRKLQHIEEEALDAGNQGLQFQVGLIVLGNGTYLGAEIGFVAYPIVHSEAIESLEQETHRAILGLAHFEDYTGGAHLVEIVGAIARRLFLPGGHNPENLVRHDDIIYQFLGRFLPKGQRQDNPGKEHQLRAG